MVSVLGHGEPQKEKAAPIGDAAEGYGEGMGNGSKATRSKKAAIPVSLLVILADRVKIFVTC